MKPFLSLILLLLPAMFFAQEDMLSLTIKVEAAQDDQLTLVSFPNLDSKGFTKLADDTYTVFTPITRGFFTVFMGTQQLKLYLEPDYKTEITAKRYDLTGTAVYSGSGAEENRWMYMKRKYDDALIEQLESSGKDFEHMKTLLNQRDHDLTARLKDNKLGYNFKQIMKSQVDSETRFMRRELTSRMATDEFTGKPCPSVVLLQPDGAKKNIQEFKGKYVYIDLWATWCGGCIMEQPYFEELAKAFEAKNIVFVKISVDDKKCLEKWKQAIADEPKGIVQLKSENGFKNDLLNKLEIQSIPRYILLAPDGTILNADAPRPSEDKAVDMLNELFLE